MLFERFEDSGLSQFSYAVGCPAAGSIAIVDPRRDIDVYMDFAEREGVAITHVLETHIHADFASGARELADRAGARLCLSAYDAGQKYDVAFAHEEISDGDEIEIGSVRIRALHTPGHTPEHLAFLIFDTHRSSIVPEILLSGDFLFIGSLGRPDLLGEEAKRDLAHRLFASVRDALAGLPDGLEVHPGHGAGSMCGAGMSARPLSTLGFERVANPYLDPELSETAFVEKILGSAPPFPPYYRRMKDLNSAGPPTLGGLPGLVPLPLSEFAALARSGVVVDLRDQLAFGGGHLPGALGIGVSGSLSTWAAWIVPYETPILLVAESEADVEPAVRALVRVGLDDVRGWLAGGMGAWRRQGLPIDTLPQMSIPELAAALENGRSVDVLDVRADGEWSAGHIDGALHVHGGLVGERLGELPRNGRPLAVICGSGYRSTAVASALKRAGFDNVRNVPGGMGAWRSAGLPVTR
jgi:hydroxyacylglutathione hydrolase